MNREVWGEQLQPAIYHSFTLAKKEIPKSYVQSSAD